MINKLLPILRKHTISLISCQCRTPTNYIILSIENDIAKILWNVEKCDIYHLINLNQFDRYINVYSNFIIIDDEHINFPNKIKYLLCFDNNTLYPVIDMILENEYMRCKDNMNYVSCIKERIYSLDGGKLKICKERIYEKKYKNIDNIENNTDNNKATSFYECENIYFNHSFSYMEHLVDLYIVQDIRQSTYRDDISNLIT